MKLKVFINRFNSIGKKKQFVDEFLLTYQKGMTVLDVIMQIQQNRDPTLAFRYECRQGICGTCGVMLNGKPVLSCSTQISPSLKKNIIEPLANFPVEKDLIVNLKPILKKFLDIKPFIDRIQKVKLTKKIANKSKPFRKCIECGCCIAGSATVSKNSNIIDPMDLVKLARYFTDPRDGINRIKIAQKGGIKHYSIEEGEKLATICPRGIPIDQAIKLLNEKYE
ncbi:succinate dehydrogenase/fumarate reductase iron-sulfur subunit [Candidatus Roizmanbacteria bacterium]|nr:succinate dehydrogenase/fumarate reductase iron-sulfur subunit [Candidatus Roizmanbacteria bacterium]